MLVGIEHRDQHIEMRQGVGEPQGAGDGQRHIAGGRAGRRRQRCGRDLPAERREQPLHQLGATLRRQRADGDFERNGAVGERLALARGARHGGAKHPVERHAEQRRRGIRTIVDILVEQALGLAAPPHQLDRVDLEQQHRLAALGAGFRKQHIGPTEGVLGLVHASGMLHQEIAEIGRRLVGGGNRQKHQSGPKVFI